MGLTDFIMMVNSQVSDGSAPEPPPVDTFGILSYEYSVSNKFLDIEFSKPVYGANDGSTPIADTDLLIIDLVTGGASDVTILSVKKPNAVVSASASDLTGGELIVRVFLTVTGTPDSTESFKIRPATDSVYDAVGNTMSTSKNTGDIKLNITPLNLYDAKLMSTVTQTGLGVSTWTDIMGANNFTQTTDADRPAYTFATRIVPERANSEYLTGGDIGAWDFQQANSFTVVVKAVIITNSGTSGYIVANKAQSVPANNNGWGLLVGTDGSFFFSMHDGTTQKFTDYNAFSGSGEHTLICVNDGGTLSVYDENNTLVGTQSSTAIGTITYTGINARMFTRDVPATSTTFFMDGSIEKIAIYNSALTSDQRVDLLQNLNQVQVTEHLTYPPTSVQAFHTSFAARNIGAFISFGMTTYTASDSYAVNSLVTPPVVATFAPPAGIIALAEGWVDSIHATGKCDMYCFTANHHIGFAVWDTNVVLITQAVTDAVLGSINLPIRDPYKNSTYDILGALVTRARSYSKPVYIYYNMGRQVNQRGSNKYGSQDFYYQFVEAQLKELIDLYSPDGFFVDGQQDDPWIDNSVGSYLHRMYTSLKAYDPTIEIITNEAPINGSMFVGGNLNKFPSDFGCYERDIGRVLTNTTEYDVTSLKNYRGTNYVKGASDIITTNTGIIYFGSEDKGATDRTQVAVQAYYDASKAVGVPLFINFSPSQDGTLQTSQVDFLTNLTL